MTEYPLVSVAVPVFNGASHIRACLASIITQEFKSLEVVVSDGGSSDGSLEILHEYEDPRLRLLPFADESRGLHGNWTRVLSACRGEYVKLVPQDDLLMPGCLQLQVDLLRSHPSSVLVAGLRNIIDNRDRVLKRGVGLGRLCGDSMTREVAAADVAVGCARAGTNLLGEPASVMLRRSALPSPPISDRWTYAIDLDLYMRTCSEGRVVLDRRVVAAFRIAPTQLSAVLAHGQSREMRSYISHLSSEYPGSVSPADVRIGKVRATLLSVIRRTLYSALVIESK